VLKIAVHGEDIVALGVVETGSEGRGLSEVAPQLNHQDSAVYGSDLFEKAIGSVAGAIVDKDKLKGFADLLHDSLEAVIEGGDVLFLVVEGYDDGVFRHVSMILLGVCFLNQGKRLFEEGLCKFSVTGRV